MPANCRVKELASNFQSALEEMGYSNKKELARELNIHPSLIRDRCNGSTDIKVIDILFYSENLSDVDPVVLFAKIINAQNPVAAFTEQETIFLQQLVKDRMIATDRMINASTQKTRKFQMGTFEKLRAMELKHIELRTKNELL